MVMMMVTNNKPKKWEIFVVVVEVGFVNDVVVFLKNLMFFFFCVCEKQKRRV
jgi:hypothetical protein